MEQQNSKLTMVQAPVCAHIDLRPELIRPACFPKPGGGVAFRRDAMLETISKSGSPPSGYRDCRP